MITFVADHADSDTPVSGIDFGNPAIDFSGTAQRLRGLGIGVMFFVEPEIEAVKGAQKSGAQAVLINCGGFAYARSIEEAQQELDRIDACAQAASRAGLTACAGRGLDRKNLVALQELNLIDEFYIGHSICTRALLKGMTEAVGEVLDVLRAPLLPS